MPVRVKASFACEHTKLSIHIWIVHSLKIGPTPLAGVIDISQFVKDIICVVNIRYASVSIIIVIVICKLIINILTVIFVYYWQSFISSAQLVNNAAACWMSLMPALSFMITDCRPRIDSSTFVPMFALTISCFTTGFTSSTTTFLVRVLDLELLDFACVCSSSEE